MMDEAHLNRMLEGLNPAQREAVDHFASPLLIIAGAGSGKTRVITHKIAKLVASLDYRPEEILGVTFTNRAAREMRERIESLTGIPSRSFRISTFHALGLSILRETLGMVGLSGEWQVMDDNDQKRLVDAICRLRNLEKTADEKDDFRRRMGMAKMGLLYPQSRTVLEEEQGWSSADVDLFAAYQQQLQDARLWDYEDLISLPVLLFRQRPDILCRYQERYRYCLVDEFQDTNPNQYALIHMLASQHQNITVVGDDDQAIYSWRGANVRFLFEFERDFPTVRTVKLEQNYRSSPRILSFANRLIQNNRQRKDKTMWTDRQEGEPIILLRTRSREEEAAQIADLILFLRKHHPEWLPLAVLYRINAQSLHFETEFLSRGISFRILKGQRFFDRKEVRDALALLRLALQPEDDLAFRRVVEALPLGIGSKTLDLLAQQAAEAHASLWQTLVSQHPQKVKSKEGLMAIHRLQQSPPETFADLLEQLFVSSGLQAYLEERREDGRILNVRELVAFIRDWEQHTPDPSFTALTDLISLDSSEADTDESLDAYLLTMHNAKGMEFPSVASVGTNPSYLPFFLRKGSSEIEEERRLFYVSTTRAIDFLVISAGAPQISAFMADVPLGAYRSYCSAAEWISEQRGETPQARTSGAPPPSETATIWVHHPFFGKGRLLQEVDRNRVLVHFEQKGEKLIDTSIVKLTRREEESHA